MKIVKRQMLRVLAFVMALCLIAVTFAGCGKETVKNAYESVSGVDLGSQILAGNSNYQLQWDSNIKAVVLVDKDGNFWSDVLYRSYLEDGSVGLNGRSPINITVVEAKTLDWNTYSSASLTEADGSVVCETIDNGIRVTYYFNAYKIAVPVEYVLNDDHITVSIDSSKILEDGTDYILASVGLAPSLCSVKNTDENANLFVPAGSGAVMKAAETAQGMLTYSGKVYGNDLSSRIPISRKDEEEIRLPVFGAYAAGKALFGIIESGAGAAVIEAEAANNRTGYSTIYPNFYVRGYDSFMYEYFGQNVWKTTQRLNDDISGQVFSVSYYPLYGDEANYNGMAKKYQSYLVNKGELKKSEAKASPYSVTFLGGTNVTKSFFGIPYQEINSLTTYEQAKAILEKLKADNGVLPVVRLLGYGDNGLRPGSIAGGSKYPSVYGSKKELKSLMEYCSDTNLFLDFDITTYTKSGNGFSLTNDVAKTAIMYKAENFPLSPTRVQDKENAYYALGRDNLLKAGDKALKKAKKYSAKAVSFSNLGENAYSDYSDNKYINRNGIDADTASIISASKKNGYVTAVAGANNYAANIADMIFDVSATSGDYDAFDYEVPFYQMVYHSYKPLYSDGVNISTNVEKEIAKSAAYGMGVSYYLTDGYVSQSDDFEEYKLFATIFEDNAQKINKTLVKDGFSKLYTSVADAALVNYEFDGAIAKSVFSNGVVIYTNLSTKAAKSPVGKLQPYQYKIG